MRHWLLKTEPNVYSIDNLLRDKKTNWNNIRNYQARNLMRDQVKKGDLALIYHSGDEKAVVGSATVVKEGYPDIDQEGGDWIQIDIQYRSKLKRPVSLATLKKEPELKNLMLIRQSRLSVTALTSAEFDCICKMGQ